MEREFEAEWRRLEGEATANLLQVAERERAWPECHAVILPSFEDCRSYTILRPPADSPAPPLGVRRVWRRHLDLGKFEAPVIRLRHGPKVQPTIDEQEAVLSPDAVASILERAAGTKVPARISERRAGADGETYVLSFGDLFVSTRFTWWCDPPEGWEPLELLLRDIAHAVDDGLT